MRAKCGSCLAAMMLVPTAWASMPESPPETHWMVLVALAGIVRKRRSFSSLPIWNLYSAPGVRPVSSQRWTLRSVLVNGLVLVLAVFQSLALSIAKRMSAADSLPTHWMVIVVVGSCCQVRNSEASGSLLTGGGTFALGALA